MFNTRLNDRLARCTFDNFIVTKQQQRKAVAAGKAFIDAAMHAERVRLHGDDDGAAWFDGNHRFPNLLLLGTCGTGKTHLAAAIVGEIFRRNRGGFATEFFRYAHLIEQWRETWSAKVSNPRTEEEDDLVTEGDFRELLTEPRILVIDDVPDQITDNERAFLTEGINDRYELKYGHIVTSNATREQFAAIVGDRVFDRLIEGGRVAILDGESYRQKVPVFPVPEVSKA